jgi:hypothetical protein
MFNFLKGDRMKKIVQGIIVATLFVIPQQTNAKYEIDDETKFMAATTGILVGGLAFIGWLAKPTSKNLFAAANDLEKQIDRLVNDVENVTNEKEVPGLLQHNLYVVTEISGIMDLLNREFRLKREFSKFLKDSPLLNIKKRDYITVAGDENNKFIRTSINVKAVRTLIEDLRSTATKMQLDEQNRSWFSRTGWKNWWNKRGDNRPTTEELTEEK